MAMIKQEEIDQLLDYWIEEKGKLGLLKRQFIIDISNNKRNLILKKLRKEGKVYFSRRRWFLK
jgi:hypothetical protein